MRHYYAVYWTYGIGTCWAQTGLPAGSLAVFDNARERDQWVTDAEDYKGGNAHTSPISAATARKMMIHELAWAWDPYSHGPLSGLSTTDLVWEYRKMHAWEEAVYA